ncbi:MAG: NUDIX hydrolase [Bacteroidales bacterium]
MNKFNIRVYGVFINNSQEVLVTDEYRLGTYMTKFPGGGLEIGEGLLDGLKRECWEELGQEVEILKHFYTTDYFQPTRLLPEPQQLISVYYLISIEEPFLFQTTGVKFDFPAEEGQQSFRFIPLRDLSEAEFTFPIDRKVVGMLTLDSWK